MISILIGLISSIALAQTAPSVKHAAPAQPPTFEKTAVAPNDPSSLKFSKVSFLEPKNGATVQTVFNVKFDVSSMKVAPAGELTPGAGYFVLIFDGKAVAKGTPLRPGTASIELKDGRTETSASLVKGKHHLTVQFFDGKGKSYGEALSQTIQVLVR